MNLTPCLVLAVLRMQIYSPAGECPSAREVDYKQKTAAAFMIGIGLGGGSGTLVV